MGRNLKYKNFGGSGYRDSTTKHYTDKKKITRSRFGIHETNHNTNAVMSESELSKYLMGDRIECLECGNLYQNLSLHLHHRHLMQKRDYCLKYGIPVNTPLASQKIRQNISDKRKEEWSDLSETKKEKKKIFLQDLSNRERKTINEVVCPKCFIVYKTKSAHKHLLCIKCREITYKKAVIKHGCKLSNIGLKCGLCDIVFFSKHPSTVWRSQKGIKVFCSRKCAGTYSRPPNEITKECSVCSKEYTLPEKRANQSKFCSKKCFHKASIKTASFDYNSVKNLVTEKGINGAATILGVSYPTIASFLKQIEEKRK